MKPIKSRTFLVQQFLIVLATTLAVMGLVLAIKTVPFFIGLNASQLETGEIHLELGSGMIGLNYLALYVSYICLYLVFEFYSFKPAFYATLNIGGALFLCYALATFILNNTLDVENSHNDALLFDMLNFDYQKTIAITLAVLTGFSLSFFVAAGIKYVTRNYFMFIRFPIASVVGLTTFVAVDIYIGKMGELATQSMLMAAITPLSQYLALILASVIPLYILRLILGIFRGRVIEDKEPSSTTTNKSMFKASEPAIPQVATPAVTPPAVEDEKETTVSQKIKFETPMPQS